MRKNKLVETESTLATNNASPSISGIGGASGDPGVYKKNKAKSVLALIRRLNPNLKGM
jgi:hypothetical protein